MDSQTLSNLSSNTSNNVMNTVSDFNNYFDRLRNITDYNTAMDSFLAEDQRRWSSEEAAIARNFNAVEAAKNRRWQESMSNTAHQREVKDLLAAGLNPILSANGGNGASVTSGATASATAPTGSKGETDKGLSSALVSLLGNNLSAMTKLADTATSALSNQQIADKQMATSELISRISALASMYGADVSAGATRYSADRHANAAMYGADVSAAASQFGALTNANAVRQAAAMSASASRYASDKNYAARIYGSERSYKASKYATDAAKLGMWVSNANTFLGNLGNFVNDWRGDTINGILGMLTGGIGSGGSSGFSGLLGALKGIKGFDKVTGKVLR